MSGQLLLLPLPRRFAGSEQSTEVHRRRDSLRVAMLPSRFYLDLKISPVRGRSIEVFLLREFSIYPLRSTTKRYRTIRIHGDFCVSTINIFFVDFGAEILPAIDASISVVFAFANRQPIRNYHFLLVFAYFIIVNYKEQFSCIDWKKIGLKCNSRSKSNFPIIFIRTPVFIATFF